MAHDFDDIVWMGHTATPRCSPPSPWASMSARAAATCRCGRRGQRVAGRLGASSMLGPLNGQMWTFIGLVEERAPGPARVCCASTRRAPRTPWPSPSPSPNSRCSPRSCTTHLEAARRGHADRSRHPGRVLRAGRHDRARPRSSRSARVLAAILVLPLPEMMGGPRRLWVLRHALGRQDLPGLPLFPDRARRPERILARRATRLQRTG